MLKIEAQLASLLKKTIGRSATVVRGSFLLREDQQQRIKPSVYVSIDQFVDTTEQMTGSFYAGRVAIKDDNSTRFREQRPGRVYVAIDLVSKDHSDIQMMRQTTIGPVLTFLHSVRQMHFSDPSDNRVALVFEDIAASLKAFSIEPIATDQQTYFLGKVRFEMNGYLHVTVAVEK